MGENGEAEPMGNAVWRVLLLAVALTAPVAGTAGCSKPAAGAALEAGLLDWINAVRAQRGLKPYQRSARLDRAAAFHACDMAVRNYFSHAGAGEPKLAARMRAAGYMFRAGNENIAYTQQAKVTSVAPIWQNSPPHWAAIIDPGMRDIGISVTVGNGHVYWVMDVAR
jgi:uncharacterized protein YkwD